MKINNKGGVSCYPRKKEQLFSNKEDVTTVATHVHGSPELSPAREHLVEAQTLMPNTQGWGRSGRLNIAPLNNVATTTIMSESDLHVVHDEHEDQHLRHHHACKSIASRS